jgi:hypothetical protein
VVFSPIWITCEELIVLHVKYYFLCQYLKPALQNLLSCSNILLIFVFLFIIIACTKKIYTFSKKNYYISSIKFCEYIYYIFCNHDDNLNNVVTHHLIVTKKQEKKYAPTLDNYGQSCFVRSDFLKMKCVCKTQMMPPAWP